MRALILAAGRGSRLHPYTNMVPKCLTELGGKTLIGRQIETLNDVGISKIIIVVGYMAEMLRLPGTQQVFNPDWATTNMVESLFCAEADFGDDFLVSYGDIIYERGVLQRLLNAPNDITVALNTAWRKLWDIRFEDPLSDAETLRLDDHGRVLEIGNAARTYDEIEAQYMGLMRFKGQALEALKNARRDIFKNPRPWKNQRPPEKAYMTDLLMELIHAGYSVHGAPVSGGWLEVDTVRDYQAYQAMFADGSISQFYNSEA